MLVKDGREVENMHQDNHLFIIAEDKVNEFLREETKQERKERIYKIAERFEKRGRNVKKKPVIDLMELRAELKNGTFHPFVKRDKVYIEDSQNGECIMVCDLKEVDTESKVL